VTRILQVVTDTNRRGAQVFATDLHEGFERQGLVVRTVALAPGDVGGLDLPVLGARRRDVATLRALRRELRQASIAIAHGSTTLPACALASVGVGTHFVYRQISDSRFWAPSGLRRLRVRAALARATSVVALWSGSAATVHEHLGVPMSRIRVIPNAVRADRFLPASGDERSSARRRFDLDPSATVVAHVGALAPEKGVDLLIDAVRDLPDVQLLVVGDGPARSELELRAADVAPGRARFVGSLDDARPAYAAADVVVLASRGGDSMPAVLIEAGLCGLPAVSTGIEAIPEVVVDGATGIIVDAAVEPLHDALRELIESPGRQHALGAAARAHCLEHFALDDVVLRWREVLDAAVG
jgi:glycosyltransferase involved in cell wall biosynthesis